MGEHNELGKIGEQLAVDFLVKNGYKICCKNYRYLKAEIDIIARKGELLTIVEVKSRSSTFLMPIADAVTPKKIKLLVMAANEYVISRELDVEVRFDIITVLKTKGKFELEHIESAFYHF
ncbi:MAG: YraN family protein [Cellulophaga sp.]